MKNALTLPIQSVSRNLTLLTACLRACNAQAGKALDDIVFDLPAAQGTAQAGILGPTQVERDEVYWAVCELVKNRLEKAKSACLPCRHRQV